jgi:dienelactone hydrolase
MISLPDERLEPERQQGTEQPVSLALKPDPVFGFLHKPSSSRTNPIAVLICPPFGWEEQSSYRGRRAWAGLLAQAGYPAFRYSFPGTGDSGGSPADPDRLEAWTQSVSEAAIWLRAATGCSRVAAIGIGLGGLVVARALTRDAAIDDAVLWALSPTGRKMVRELRAHSKFVAARYPPDAQALSPLPEDVAELTGFLMSAETERALEQLDLTELSFSPATDRRILLIGRDRVGIDERLKEHLASSGATVTVATTSDHASLMTEPQEAEVPLDTINATLSWLAEAAPTSRPAEVAISGPSVERSTMELVHGGVRLREKPVVLKIADRRDFGIVCEPVTVARAPVHAVFLGAAALPHAGPNRAWVELARRWATLGVPSVRMDLAGIGDADGDESGLIDNAGLYSEKRQEEVLALLDHLEEEWGWDRFVLVGLCAGAYWSLHAALARRQVAAALMINLYAFFWSDALILERDRREATAAMRSAARAGLSRHDLTASNVRRALRGLAGKLSAEGWRSLEAAQTPEVDRSLDRLRDQGTHALLLLSDGEPLYEQFEREGRVQRLAQWPTVTVERIPSPDHMFRDLRAQRFVHERLERALERVLADERGA